MKLTIENIIVKELQTSSEEVMKSDDLEWLQTIRFALNGILVNLNGLIDGFELKYSYEGVSGNYHWLLKVKKKKRLYGLMHETIKHRISQLKKIEKERKQKSVEKILIEKLKENTDIELFKKLAKEAELAATQFELKAKEEIYT